MPECRVLAFSLPRRRGCGFRQARWSGGEPLAGGSHVIADRVSLLDVGAQFEAAMARFVHASLLLAIGQARRERSKTDCRASGSCLSRRLRRPGRESRQGECQADPGHDHSVHRALSLLRGPWVIPPTARPEVELTAMDADPAGPDRGSSVSSEPGQPRSIKVFIRSAGQTRLSGALANASLDGLLPSGKPTM